MTQPQPQSSSCGRMIRVRCHRDTETLLTAVTVRLKEQCADASRTGPFTIMLSGGSTPFPAYARVAADAPVTSPYLFLSFTDDRHVPPDDEASNVHNTRPMIDALGLPDDRILYPNTTLPLEECVENYQEQWDTFFTAGGTIPLALLGLGEDGHTCSLFSDDDLERGRGRRVVGVQRPDGRGGISATPDLLSRVEHIIFLVAGEAKAEMLRRLIHDTRSIVAGKAISAHPNVSVWTEPAAWPVAT